MVDISSRASLRADGLSSRDITAAVRENRLIRGRRDNYLPGGTPEEIVRAVRVGGRLTCLSLLVLLGVFVLANDTLHVHVPENASRLRSPHARGRRLEARDHRGVILHWTRLSLSPGVSASVSIIDALSHAVRCQPPRAAIATIDSALRLGLLPSWQLGDVFELLPARFAVLARLVDPRSESGPETLMRLLLRALPCTAEIQVRLDGIGRVDFLVDGWLIIECDSVEFHVSREQFEADRERDLRAAIRGFTTFRPTANMIMHRPDEVLAAVRALLAAH